MLELRVGQTLVDTYKIERLIAEGGMGSVYEATHMRVPKRFAVKFLNMQLVEKSEALVRFRREAEIIATLDHPNVVGLYDYNVTEDGVPYIVLEYLDGEHLGKRLDRGPMQLDEAIRVIVPVMHALAAAHKHGIIHRDLKPENIILCKGDVVKVVDFGIAKICGYDLTGLNSIIGTVPYMSPEQIGGGAIDGRADMFALASIFYEMLSGQMAFGGSQSVPEVAMRVMHHQPPFLSSVSQPVNEVIAKAMAKDPAARYPDLEAFLRALLEAASRPDETPTEPQEPEEGLPPLQGEATAIMHRAPAGPAPQPYIAASSTERTVMARSDMPLVTPAVGGPSPLAGGAEETPSGDAPEGYAPLAEQATVITRMGGDDGGAGADTAPLAQQATVITRMDGDNGTATDRTPAVPLAAAQSEAAKEPSGLVPYSPDAQRYHPLVTKAVPVAPMRPEDHEPTGMGAQAGTDLAEESTAITRGAVKREGEAPAPQLRLLHSVATVQQPVVDGNGTSGGSAGDGILTTAEVARPQLDLPPTARPGRQEAAKTRPPVLEPGAELRAGDQRPTEMRPVISDREETGRALLPPPELQPAAPQGGTLKLVLLGLGVAAVLIVVGLIVRVLAK